MGIEENRTMTENEAIWAEINQLKAEMEQSKLNRARLAGHLDALKFMVLTMNEITKMGATQVNEVEDILDNVDGKA